MAATLGRVAGAAGAPGRAWAIDSPRWRAQTRRSSCSTSSPRAAAPSRNIPGEQLSLGQLGTGARPPRAQAGGSHGQAALPGIGADRRARQAAAGADPLPIQRLLLVDLRLAHRSVHRHNAFHEGIDFVAEQGTSITAAAGGAVIYAAAHPQYGNMVEIDHGNDLVTRYAHASKILVQRGRRGAAGKQDR